MIKDKQQYELEQRLKKIERMREERKALKADKKRIGEEIKVIDDAIESLLDECRNIRTGQGEVQESIPA
jgi:Tfp pilus assembly protein PilN